MHFSQFIIKQGAASSLFLGITQYSILNKCMSHFVLKFLTQKKTKSGCYSFQGKNFTFCLAVYVASDTENFDLDWEF